MSIIKHVTLQKIVAHDFRYDPRMYFIHIVLTNMFRLALGHLQGDTVTVLQVRRLEYLGHALRMDGERTVKNA